MGYRRALDVPNSETAFQLYSVLCFLIMNSFNFLNLNEKLFENSKYYFIIKKLSLN